MSGRYAGLAVLWDLDGTLVDSQSDIAAAVDRALARNALPRLGEPAVRRHIGSGAQHLVTACHADALGLLPAGVARAEVPPVERVLADFFAAYKAHIADQTALYPGLRELLADLTVPQAIVTNKPIGLALALLDALGIRERFGAVYGGESVPRRKPDPMMLHAAMADLGVQHAVVIGDGPHDVGAARAAGLPVIGVDWGINRPEGADVRVGTVSALRALLGGANSPSAARAPG